MISIYEVVCERDMTEGRGGKEVVIRFMDEQEAWDYANSKSGIMGRRPSNGDWRTYSGGKDWDVKCVSVWENSEYSPEEVAKQKALSKLTPAERKLLGL
jgi:hypothetical protein